MEAVYVVIFLWWWSRWSYTFKALLQQLSNIFEFMQTLFNNFELEITYFIDFQTITIITTRMLWMWELLWTSFIGLFVFFLLLWGMNWILKSEIKYIEGIPIFNPPTDQPIPFIENNLSYCPARVLTVVEWLGPLFQLKTENQLILFVNDGTLAKFVLDTIHAKASLKQNSKKSIFQVENISTLNSNAAWVQRRQAIKQCCSFTNFQHCTHLLNAHLNSFQAMLSSLAGKREIHCMQELFGRFVLDLLLQIQFEMDSNYLYDEREYKVTHS